MDNAAARMLCGSFLLPSNLARSEKKYLIFAGLRCGVIELYKERIYSLILRWRLSIGIVRGLFFISGL